MKSGLKIYQKEIFNDDLKRKEKRLRTVVSNNFFENLKEKIQSTNSAQN